MTDALKTQEGGSHYKNMAIQPIEFCCVNRYDPASFSVLKYVSRHRLKNGREDLLKGRHFVQLRRDLRRDNPSLFGFKALDVIPMSEYVEGNNLVGLERAILMDLHYWTLGQSGLEDYVAANRLIRQFDRLIDLTYPQKD